LGPQARITPGHQKTTTTLLPPFNVAIANHLDRHIQRPIEFDHLLRQPASIRFTDIAGFRYQFPHFMPDGFAQRKSRAPG
jgi:hypothetical protein